MRVVVRPLSVRVTLWTNGHLVRRLPAPERTGRQRFHTSVRTDGRPADSTDSSRSKGKGPHRTPAFWMCANKDARYSHSSLVEGCYELSCGPAYKRLERAGLRVGWLHSGQCVIETVDRSRVISGDGGLLDVEYLAAFPHERRSQCQAAGESSGSLRLLLLVPSPSRVYGACIAACTLTAICPSLSIASSRSAGFRLQP